MCLYPNKVYEVEDPVVKLIFRKNFTQSRKPGPVIINIGVFLYSYFTSTNTLFSFVINGVEVYVMNFLTVMVKSGISALVANTILAYLNTTTAVKSLITLVV